MRVAFDEQIFLAQSAGGISRYFSQLISQFRSDATIEVDPVLAWTWTQNQYLLGSGDGRALPGSSILWSDALRRYAYYAANIKARHKANDEAILHHTFYHPHFLRAGYRGRRIVTIYDMTPEILPGEFPGGNPHLAKKQYVQKADMILCISEQTARDLVDVYGPLEQPVRVTYLGVGPEFSPGKAPLPGIPGRYVMFVGRRGSYKDYRVAVEAVAGLRDDVALIAAGGGPFSSEEMRLHDALGVSSRVRQLDVADGDLTRLYANALAFVYPSRYEGFGLPTLEAMASGTPAILAAASVHPEIGGEAGLYFAPGDADALRGVLELLIGDNALRDRHIDLGLRRAQEFSWVRTAARTAEAYAAVAETLPDASFSAEESPRSDFWRRAKVR